MERQSGLGRPLPISERTRESHYVPQATLRRWSEDGMNVHAYRLLVSHQNVPEWQPHTLRGLTKQRDLYTTFAGDQQGDDFEKFITREIEEPGPTAIKKLIANAKMKPTDRHSIARFVAAQQMRTPLFFIEWDERRNERMPQTLQSILDEVGRKSRAELAAAERDPDTANYLREKLRVTGRKETGPWHATPAQTAELQRFVVERALRWIVARQPEPWISALRPRVVDTEAFAIEQESWRTWNSMHLDSEAEFNTPMVPPATS
jgi:hypothetical protein